MGSTHIRWVNTDSKSASLSSEMMDGSFISDLQGDVGFYQNWSRKPLCGGQSFKPSVKIIKQALDSAFDPSNGFPTWKAIENLSKKLIDSNCEEGPISLKQQPSPSQIANLGKGVNWAKTSPDETHCEISGRLSKKMRASDSLTFKVASCEVIISSTNDISNPWGWKKNYRGFKYLVRFPCKDSNWIYKMWINLWKNLSFEFR